MEAAVAKDWHDLIYQRKLLCRLVFAFIFFFLLYYWYSNTLVHQLQSPVLIFPYVDLSYWVLHFFKLPELVTGNPLIAGSFDFLLFASCILSFLFPERKIFITAFFVLYALYYFIFNSYGTQHTHSKIGILMIPLPFMFPRRMFTYLWEATRYFTLFVYADAFLWKLVRTYFFEQDHGMLVVKKNLVSFMFYNPDSFYAGIYRWLLERPFLLQVFFIAGLVMEGLFIVGFFTKRADSILLVVSIVLPFGFLIFSDAFFLELLVLSFTLTGFASISPRKIRLVQS